jgi:Tol biopolymer transport system component
MSDSPPVLNEPFGQPGIGNVDRAAVREELDRITAGHIFHQAEQPIRLLRFIVECTLTGDETPKEYRLAVEALGRGPDFDPRNDTIVRVQVRKLRAKLAKYYETEGASDPVIIELPVGLYAAKFHRSSAIRQFPGTAPGTKGGRRIRWRWIGAALLLCAAVAAAMMLQLLRKAPGPVEVPQLTRLTWQRGLYLAPSLSADGRKLVYTADRGSGNQDLWMQDTGGGEPTRLSSDSMNRQEPAISPDGRRIVFRSIGANVGLWAMTIGSTEPPSRFSREGRQPRFSSDGTRLTFWVPGAPDGPYEPYWPLYFPPHSSVRALQGGLIFVTDPNTLRVRLLPLTLAAAGLPGWSPDGRFLMVYGAAEMAAFRQEDADWWVAPSANAMTPVKPVRTGIAAQLRRLGAEPVLVPPCWVGDKLYFAASSGETVDLWEAGLSEKTHQSTGSLRKISLGTGNIASLTSSATGKLAFPVVFGDVNLWELPVHANTGAPAGPLKRITDGDSPSFWSSVSEDGRQVAYASERLGSLNLFTRSLDTGAEWRLVSNAEQPRIAPSGSKVVFNRPEPPNVAVYEVNTEGGDALRILANGGELTGWSRDQRWLLHDRGAHLHGHRYEIETKKDNEFSRHPVADSYAQALSPDLKWLALICKGRLYLAKLIENTAAPDDQWVQVTDGSSSVERARWSPDGNLLYFLSDRDGHRCIWAQRLDSASREPSGPATAVFHFHTGPSMDMLAPGVVSFDVSADKLVFVLGEFRTGLYQYTR